EQSQEVRQHLREIQHLSVNADFAVKVAGEVRTAKQAPHRPGIAPALGLRAGRWCSHEMQAVSLNQETPMWLKSLLNARKSRTGRGAIRHCSPALRLEYLEDRSLPSTCTVVNLNDAGAGSLRQAIQDANATAGADVITFAPAAHGTLTLAS